jgi:hypothetical protein
LEIIKYHFKKPGTTPILRFNINPFNELHNTGKCMHLHTAQ